MVDRYVKVVLTVIAATLVCIAVEGSQIVKPAEADQPVHVVIDSFGYNAFQNAGPLQIIQR
jgi:hypothetical protein